MNLDINGILFKSQFLYEEINEKLFRKDDFFILIQLFKNSAQGLKTIHDLHLGFSSSKIDAHYIRSKSNSNGFFAIPLDKMEKRKNISKNSKSSILTFEWIEFPYKIHQ